MGAFQGELKGHILPGSRERLLDSFYTSVLGDRFSGNLSGTRWSTAALAPWQEVQRVPASLEDSDQAAGDGIPFTESSLQSCGLTGGLPCQPKAPGVWQRPILWKEVHRGGLSLASRNLFSQAGLTWKSFVSIQTTESIASTRHTPGA